MSIVEDHIQHKIEVNNEGHNKHSFACNEYLTNDSLMLEERLHDDACSKTFEIKVEVPSSTAAEQGLSNFEHGVQLPLKYESVMLACTLCFEEFSNEHEYNEHNKMMHMSVKPEPKLGSDSSEPHTQHSSCASSLSDNVRSRRVSGRQLELLWDYLDSHRDIAVAFNRSLQAKEYSKQRWKELADIVNSQGNGAHRDWKGWSKYWVDYKAKLKKRISTLRSSQERNGGGSSSEPPLTAIEHKFLQILGEDYGQGLQSVRMETFEPFEPPKNDAIDSVAVEEDTNSPSISHILPSDETSATSPQQPELPPDAVPHTPQPSPFHQRLQHSPYPNSQAIPVADTKAPRRRRRRRDPLMTQEAARRALVQASQHKADAARRSSIALERIAQGVTEGVSILRNIERIMSAARSDV